MYVMLMRFSAIFLYLVQASPIPHFYILAIQDDDQPHHSGHGGMVRPMLNTMGSVLVSSLAMQQFYPSLWR